MKIADSDTIKIGEHELLETLKEKLDSSVVEKLAAQNLQLEKMTFRGGDIVIHDNKIAYKLEIEAQVAVSLLFDRDGNTLSAMSEPPEPVDVAFEPDSINEQARQEDMPVTDDPLSLEKEPGMIHGNEENKADLETILRRNRSYWLEQSGAAASGSAFEDILQKNRDFWTSH